MWNTGCNVIYNRTAKRLLYVVDGEDTKKAADSGDRQVGSPSRDHPRRRPWPGKTEHGNVNMIT